MRPRSVVLDASVAISIVLMEPDGSAAAASLSGWTRDGVRIVVPSHFWLEITNALLRSHRWSGQSVLEAVHQLDRLQIETVDLDRASVVQVIDLCERHGLTSYDAAYLAIADSFDALLVTFDRGLAEAAGRRAIRPGPSKLSESTASYERDITWPSYQGASAYLAKLRAEAARPA